MRYRAAPPMLSRLKIIDRTSSGKKLPLCELAETSAVSIAHGLASLHDDIIAPFGEGIASNGDAARPVFGGQYPLTPRE
jgi:hypothetical protein